jgi:hypothetical protein
MSDKFDAAIRKWLADDYGAASRAKMYAGGLVQNRLPRSVRPAPAVHWTARHVLAASAPLVALYYGTIGLTTAYVAAGGLFAANVVVSALGSVAAIKPSVEADTDEALVRFGDLLSALRQGPVPKDKRGDAINACLGLIEVQARRVTKTRKGELSVAWVEYKGSSNTTMTIRHRNPGNTRPVNREFDCANLLGHHACRAGASPRVVHNVRHFGSVKSPTHSKVEYRSILFIPLQPNNGGGRIKGFVSIDCARTYAFYGNRSSDIIVSCTPVLEMLKEITGRAD